MCGSIVFVFSNTVWLNVVVVDAAVVVIIIITPTQNPPTGGSPDLTGLGGGPYRHSLVGGGGRPRCVRSCTLELCKGQVLRGTG